MYINTSFATTAKDWGMNHRYGYTATESQIVGVNTII